MQDVTARYLNPCIYNEIDSIYQKRTYLGPPG